MLFGILWLQETVIAPVIIRYKGGVYFPHKVRFCVKYFSVILHDRELVGMDLRSKSRFLWIWPYKDKRKSHEWTLSNCCYVRKIFIGRQSNYRNPGLDKTSRITDTINKKINTGNFMARKAAQRNEQICIHVCQVGKVQKREISVMP